MNHSYSIKCEGIKICDYATSKILISPVRKFRPDAHFVLCFVCIMRQSFIAWLRMCFFPKVAQVECNWCHSNWANFSSLCYIPDGTGSLQRCFLVLKATSLCNRYWQNSPCWHLVEKYLIYTSLFFSLKLQHLTPTELC